MIVESERIVCVGSVSKIVLDVSSRFGRFVTSYPTLGESDHTIPNITPINECTTSTYVKEILKDAQGMSMRCSQQLQVLLQHYSFT